MASVLIVAVLVLLNRRTSANPLHAHDRSIRPYGTCKSFDIPIFATADSAIYDIPRVNNDVEATAWAIWDATRTNPHGPYSRLQNTTTSETFKIHAQLCVPKARSPRGDILQLATHGVHYDSRYWDSAYQPEQHSYVDASLKAGYSIFTYDRLGVGQSDHPDAYTVVQGAIELEILRQLTLMARNGSLYDAAKRVQTKNKVQLQAPAKPDKVIHIGHSFGSVLTSSFLANYAKLSDGAIITGYLLGLDLASAGSTSWSLEYAATANPPYDRGSGYVVAKNDGIQNVFFGGNITTAYTPALFEYGNAIKQPVPIGEIASSWRILNNFAPNFTKPIQFLLPEKDFYICRGDCVGLTNATDLRATTYPNASAIEVVIQPNTGHALPLHNNATAGFQLTFDFLKSNGL
ncbi:hypothetical protein B0A48_17537 [Cryoendolithus antarcticus]|uniref:AB hydrolase-1 domain-containing protein n=1 Tax=Cryoendolithus antarcticus TaxID=1507870 RepID=A0A1V8SCE3_9PEZI|nr:hypothetical protein B0A48_17537 [Cryoendolithus antarcticus]